jgi:ribosomal protein S18 acetylase RimI-like enzyme
MPKGYCNYSHDNMFTVRRANDSDKHKILELYKKVATIAGGIARTAEEITPPYVQNFMDHSSKTGMELVIENGDTIIAEMHCYQLSPKVFHHILSELTIVVDPDFHGKGVGKKIFTYLLDHITTQRPDILRVELIARESNQKAIAFYKQLGFKEEGRFEQRIANQEGFEADIPMAWFNPCFK